MIDIETALRVLSSAGIEFIVGNPTHKLDHALAFLEVVDHRRGRHAEDVQVRVALGGLRGQRRHQLPPLRDVLDGPLLGVVDFVHNDEVDWLALDQPPHPLRRIRLLKRLVV